MNGKIKADQQAEDYESFQPADEQLLSGAVIAAAVAFKFRLTVEVLPDLDLAPEIVNAHREKGQQEIDDVDAEQRAPVAAEPQPECLRRE